MACDDYTNKKINFDASKYVYSSSELVSKFTGSSYPMMGYKIIYVTLRQASKLMAWFKEDMKIRKNCL